MEYDVLLAKAGTVRRCLERIADTLGDDCGRLEEWDAQDIVVLNLQRGTQAVLDMAAHIAADLHEAPPRTLKEHFRILGAHGIISKELEKSLIGMVGFRNIAVHNYQELDVAILRSIVEHRLGDLEAFCRAVLAYGTQNTYKDDTNV